MASKDLAPMMVKGRQLDQNNMNSGGMLRCFRQFSANLPPWLGTRSPVVLKVASYRSQYSLDFLYPTSNRDFVSNPGAQASQCCCCSFPTWAANAIICTVVRSVSLWIWRKAILHWMLIVQWVDKLNERTAPSMNNFFFKVYRSRVIC